MGLFQKWQEPRPEEGGCPREETPEEYQYDENGLQISGFCNSERNCVGQLRLLTTIIHNHDPVEALSALPQHRIPAMSEEECATVNSMHRNGHSPLQILSALQLLNPASHLIVKDVYSLLHNLWLDELASSTLI